MKAAHNPFNEEIRARLDDYRNSYSAPLTNKDIAKKLGCGSTQISKYLNGKPDWDVTDLEARIEDMLKTAALRRSMVANDPIVTSVSRQVFAVCEAIRKTDDVGLIYGDAGAGKTIAIGMYVDANPTTIAITATRWSCNAVGLEREIFRAVDSGTFRPKHQTRAEWLSDRLRASGRLLIIDNAHRLTKSGIEWMFDFHDATQIPVALVGNPEVLDRIKESDQSTSRIGIVEEVNLQDSAHIAREIIRRLAPGSEGDISDLGRTIVDHKGHLRALKKHLLLVPELITVFGGDVREALLGAHTKLVSDFQLG